MGEVTASPKRQTNGFLQTISVVIALMTKGANRLTRKHKSSMKDDDWKIELRTPKSSFMVPKKLLSNISNKALLPFIQKKNHRRRESDSAVEYWGDGGVWQKEILMGGKCEPLDFSGVIYYDSTGNQTTQVPLRSPRVSPLPGYLTRQR
ncbi:hypothetical protein TanjilG_26289 [Lupinus angustifolius]|uniref:Uncharacterized protein n=1 Tax=Lupinus angustifolius TaxID=3871 RepID=A0A4P1R2D3_LUPAN|nr:PREDICTED: uncharacterized protein LOC109362167 [Lupinus angustifolius]OIV99951.1 hypothetical protein TanjilG_26289 [Lupinus angustifolius]